MWKDRWKRKRMRCYSPKNIPPSTDNDQQNSCLIPSSSCHRDTKISKVANYQRKDFALLKPENSHGSSMKYTPRNHLASKEDTFCEADSKHTDSMQYKEASDISPREKDTKKVQNVKQPRKNSADGTTENKKRHGYAYKPKKIFNFVKKFFSSQRVTHPIQETSVDGMIHTSHSELSGAYFEHHSSAEETNPVEETEKCKTYPVEETEKCKTYPVEETEKCKTYPVEETEKCKTYPVEETEKCKTYPVEETEKCKTYPVEETEKCTKYLPPLESPFCPKEYMENDCLSRSKSANTVPCKSMLQRSNETYKKDRHLPPKPNDLLSYSQNQRIDNDQEATTGWDQVKSDESQSLETTSVKHISQITSLENCVSSTFDLSSHNGHLCQDFESVSTHDNIHSKDLYKSDISGDIRIRAPKTTTANYEFPAGKYGLMEGTNTCLAHQESRPTRVCGNTHASSTHQQCRIQQSSSATNTSSKTKVWSAIDESPCSANQTSVVGNYHGVCHGGETTNKIQYEHGTTMDRDMHMNDMTSVGSANVTRLPNEYSVTNQMNVDMKVNERKFSDLKPYSDNDSNIRRSVGGNNNEELRKVTTGERNIINDYPDTVNAIEGYKYDKIHQFIYSCSTSSIQTENITSYGMNDIVEEKNRRSSEEWQSGDIDPDTALTAIKTIKEYTDNQQDLGPYHQTNRDESKLVANTETIVGRIRHKKYGTSLLNSGSFETDERSVDCSDKWETEDKVTTQNVSSQLELKVDETQITNRNKAMLQNRLLLSTCVLDPSDIEIPTNSIDNGQQASFESTQPDQTIPEKPYERSDTDTAVQQYDSFSERSYPGNTKNKSEDFPTRQDDNNSSKNYLIWSETHDNGYPTGHNIKEGMGRESSYTCESRREGKNGEILQNEKQFHRKGFSNSPYSKMKTQSSADDHKGQCPSTTGGNSKSREHAVDSGCEEDKKETSSTNKEINVNEGAIGQRRKGKTDEKENESLQRDCQKEGAVYKKDDPTDCNDKQGISCEIRTQSASRSEGNKGQRPSSTGVNRKSRKQQDHSGDHNKSSENEMMRNISFGDSGEDRNVPSSNNDEYKVNKGEHGKRGKDEINGRKNKSLQRECNTDGAISSQDNYTGYHENDGMIYDSKSPSTSRSKSSNDERSRLEKQFHGNGLSNSTDSKMKTQSNGDGHKEQRPSTTGGLRKSREQPVDSVDNNKSTENRKNGDNSSGDKSDLGEGKNRPSSNNEGKNVIERGNGQSRKDTTYGKEHKSRQRDFQKDESGCSKNDASVYNENEGMGYDNIPPCESRNEGNNDERSRLEKQFCGKGYSNSSDSKMKTQSNGDGHKEQRPSTTGGRSKSREQPEDSVDNNKSTENRKNGDISSGDQSDSGEGKNRPSSNNEDKNKSATDQIRKDKPDGKEHKSRQRDFQRDGSVCSKNDASGFNENEEIGYENRPPCIYRNEGNNDETSRLEFCGKGYSNSSDSKMKTQSNGDGHKGQRPSTTGGRGKSREQPEDSVDNNKSTENRKNGDISSGDKSESGEGKNRPSSNNEDKKVMEGGNGQSRKDTTDGKEHKSRQRDFQNNGTECSKNDASVYNENEEWGYENIPPCASKNEGNNDGRSRLEKQFCGKGYSNSSDRKMKTQSNGDGHKGQRPSTTGELSKSREQSKDSVDNNKSTENRKNGDISSGDKADLGEGKNRPSSNNEDKNKSATDQIRKDKPDGKEHKPRQRDFQKDEFVCSRYDASGYNENGEMGNENRPPCASKNEGNNDGRSRLEKQFCGKGYSNSSDSKMKTQSNGDGHKGQRPSTTGGRSKSREQPVDSVDNNKSTENKKNGDISSGDESDSGEGKNRPSSNNEDKNAIEGGNGKSRNDTTYGKEHKSRQRDFQNNGTECSKNDASVYNENEGMGYDNIPPCESRNEGNNDERSRLEKQFCGKGYSNSSDSKMKTQSNGDGHKEQRPSTTGGSSKSREQPEDSVDNNKSTENRKNGDISSGDQSDSGEGKNRPSSNNEDKNKSATDQIRKDKPDGKEHKSRQRDFQRDGSVCSRYDASEYNENGEMGNENRPPCIYRNEGNNDETSRLEFRGKGYSNSSDSKTKTQSNGDGHKGQRPSTTGGRGKSREQPVSSPNNSYGDRIGIGIEDHHIGDIPAPTHLDESEHQRTERDPGRIHSQRSSVESSANPDVRPKHQDLSNYRTRVKSYEHAPSDLKARKDRLAEDGWYYSGRGTSLTCFSCNIILDCHDTEMKLWKRHACLSPNCAYLIQVKGERRIRRACRDFINQESIKTNVTQDNDVSAEHLATSSHQQSSTWSTTSIPQQQAFQTTAQVDTNATGVEEETPNTTYMYCISGTRYFCVNNPDRSSLKYDLVKSLESIPLSFGEMQTFLDLMQLCCKVFSNIDLPRPCPVLTTGEMEVFVVFEDPRSRGRSSSSPGHFVAVKINRIIGNEVHVTIFDHLHRRQNNEINQNTLRLIVKLLDLHAGNKLLVQIYPVRGQIADWDCGPLVLNVIMHIRKGKEDYLRALFDQARIRSHLVFCIQTDTCTCLPPISHEHERDEPIVTHSYIVHPDGSVVHSN